MPLRRRRLQAGIVALALVSACGGSNEAPTPTTPTPPTPSPVTLRSIAIAGPVSLEVGATAALSASGTYSDGATQDVTATVTWTSSTPAQCSMTAGGVLTALTAGNCEARAALAGVMAAKDVDVRSQPPPPPRLIEISGIVHRAPPTNHLPVAGATIEIMDGALTGRRFTADASGRFTLPPLPEAPVRLHASAAGFWNDVYHVKDFPRDTNVEIGLLPEPAERTVVLSGADQCTLPQSPFQVGSTSEARILGTFDVHHSGDVRVDLAGTKLDIFEYVLFFLQRRLPSGELERLMLPGHRLWWTLPLKVEGGYTYSLELYHPLVNCSTGMALRRPWTVTFRHPN